jgi:hypothetical protein
MWALIVISISVLYDEYITLLQWVSHNLNSIQKTVTQECHMTTIIIMQQSHTDNMNWELTEHIIVSYRNWREMQSTMSVREESDETSYKTTMHALQRQWSLH